MNSLTGGVALERLDLVKVGKWQALCFRNFGFGST